MYAAGIDAAADYYEVGYGMMLAQEAFQSLMVIMMAWVPTILLDTIGLLETLQ
ncbi:MAG: hypothetical protein CM15mP123_05710 [Gammaproteobacteria bacterium]|nr:MAG: hypothetical protein CM15mP123_05710 [Gammaproteobacteria bacterium]